MCERKFTEEIKVSSPSLSRESPRFDRRPNFGRLKELKSFQLLSEGEQTREEGVASLHAAPTFRESLSRKIAYLEHDRGILYRVIAARSGTSPGNCIASLAIKYSSEFFSLSFHRETS